jgi:hypothetical protein
LSVFCVPEIGLAKLKRTNTSFTVPATREFCRWNLRVAVAASLVSRNRFGTCAIAAKTSSDRIVFSSRHRGLKLLFDRLLGLFAFAVPKTPDNEKSTNVLESVSLRAIELDAASSCFCSVIVGVPTDPDNLRRMRPSTGLSRHCEALILIRSAFVNRCQPTDSDLVEQDRLPFTDSVSMRETEWHVSCYDK